MSQRVVLTLMSRAYCHLCHDMETELRKLADQFGCEIEVVDVDADATLEARYNERVPVLLHGERELSQYFLDVAKVRDYLGKIG